MNDVVIKDLIESMNTLINTQEKLARELSNISKKLCNKDLLDNRLDMLDKEITESFKRIDSIATIQASDKGCNSVRLLTKDVQSLNKDTLRLVGVTEEHRIKLERIDEDIAKNIAPSTIKWVTGLLVAYSIMFGTYIVTSINKLNSTDVKTLSMLNRNIKDTDKLMEYKFQHINNKNITTTEE